MLFQEVLQTPKDRNGIKKQDQKKESHAKKERNRSQKEGIRLHTPTSRRKGSLFGKVSFCTLKRTMSRASLAVETAFVLPIFFLGMVTMISFMDVYRLQTEHLSKLCQTAKESGMYAYGTSGNGPAELTLPDVYSYQPIGGLIPLSKVWMRNSVKVHTWTGRDVSSWKNVDKTRNTEMVYVTETGSVYHKRADCSYLKLSIFQTSGTSVSSLRNNSGEKYHACEICSRNQKPSGTVYLTMEGNRYHNLETCSGLKRTIRLVCRDDVGHMSACSRCGR